MSELYELPDGWEWTSIGKIVLKTENKNPLQEPELYFTYIDISSIDNQLYCIKETKYLIGCDAPSRAKKKIKKGDIVFATTRPNLKNIAIVNNEYENPIASTGFCVLRANQSNDFKYLFYYLLTKSLSEQIESKIRGAQYPAVSDKDLMNCDIPLPPLSEQQRIVSKLDLLFEKIDKSIALHQKNMDETNVFMGSVLNDVFGELEEKYGFIKIKDTVLQTKNINLLNDLEKPFTYIDISSIDNKSFKILEPKQLIGKEAPSRAKKEVLMGDIVYATTRPNLKNIAIVNKEYDNPIASTGFCVLRVNEKTINSYLFYYLITDKLFEQIEPNIRGAQYPATSDKDLKNCNIPNTPLSIQQKTVEYLDEILEKMEKIRSIQKVKMDSLKALKASILDQAFRGEL